MRERRGQRRGRDGLRQGFGLGIARGGHGGERGTMEDRGGRDVDRGGGHGLGALELRSHDGGR